MKDEKEVDNLSDLKMNDLNLRRVDQKVREENKQENILRNYKDIYLLKKDVLILNVKHVNEVKENKV